MLKRRQTESILVWPVGGVPVCIFQAVNFVGDFRKQPVRTRRSARGCRIASLWKNQKISHRRSLLADWFFDLWEHRLIDAADPTVGGGGFEFGGEPEPIGWQADFTAAGLIADFEVENSIISDFAGIDFEQGVDDDFTVVDV